MKRWIEVFRTGRHTDSAGQTREWTEADLDRMVAGYSTSQHEAPIVIGHPQDNAPAFGWVRALARKGAKLFAEVHQLQPEFVDMVRQGLFKKRSLSVYPDGTLRHVGFLGAQPPAVKGLADVAFAGQPAVQVEQQAEDFEDELGVPAAAQALPQASPQFSEPVGALDFYLTPTASSTAAPDSARRSIASQFLEKAQQLNQGAAPRAAAQLPGADRLVQLQQQVDALQQDLRQRDWQQFADALTHSGRLLPAQLGPVLALFESLSQVAQPVQFSDAEGRVLSKQPLALFQEFLATLPVQVEFGERATAGRAAAPGARSVEDMASGIRKHLESAASAGRTCSYAEAMEAVLRNNSYIGGRT